jgi:hypothetical protein
MVEKASGKAGRLHREYHKFETRDAALRFLSERLAAVDSQKTAVSLSEGSFIVTLEDHHKTRYTLMRGGLQVMIERRVEPSVRRPRGTGPH